MSRALLVSVLVTVGFALLTTVARAADGTIKVVTVGYGSVDFKPEPKAVGDSDAPSCQPPDQVALGSRTELVTCTLTYDVGTPVTVTAHGGAADFDGGATSFSRWSDDRCPAADSCTLTVGSDPQSIAALFSPQRVSVWLTGTGSVVGTPGGAAGNFEPTRCTVDPGTEPVQCSDDFALDSPVTLTASPSTGDWLPTAVGATLPLCDSVAAPDCRLTADRPRWASVGFGASAIDNQIPPEVSVRFSIRKGGGGSGTVRGRSLDCGGQCAVEKTFGDQETLEAVADSGSRFAGWRGACGSAPTCRLAVGPVTAITAVFERAVSQNGPTTGPTQTPSPRKSRLVKLNVRGHGRKRAILMRVELGGPASVRARLLKGRRQVTARRWQLQPGSYLLRMKVPARVRPGRYRIGLTVRGGGQTQQITRPVRLRR